MKACYNRVIIVILTGIFLSCGSKSNQEIITKSKKPGQGNIENTGNIKVECKDGFCYYIPGNELQEGLPLVYIFDPHAKGDVAIKKYVPLAEKHQVMLAASLVSRNGMPLESVQRHFNATRPFLRDSLKIDNNKVILAGFSGGGRVATELAKINKGIIAAITCGAANGDIPKPSVKTVIICGNGDFNYVECMEVALTLSKKNANIDFLGFNGPHTWPDRQTMDKAFDFALNGKTGHGGIQISNDELFVLGKEKRERADLVRFFAMKPTSWWMSRLKSLKGKSEENSLEGQSAKRLLAYVGMICYTYTKSALNKGDGPFIDHCLQIYGYIEPENPDMYFYKACYFAMTGAVDASFDALERSVNNGFINKKEIKTSPYLNSIRGDARYGYLVDKYHL